MKWFVIYVVSLFGLWHATDVRADNVVESTIIPLLFVIVLLAFMTWLFTTLGGRYSSSNDEGGGATIGAFFGGGDACGRSDDGDGGC